MNRCLALIVVLAWLSTTSEVSAQLFHGHRGCSPQVCQPPCCQPCVCAQNCFPPKTCQPQPCPCQQPLPCQACQPSCLPCQQPTYGCPPMGMTKAQMYGKCIRECAQNTNCDTYLGECALHCYCLIYMPAGTNCNQAYPPPNLQVPCPDMAIGVK